MGVKVMMGSARTTDRNNRTAFMGFGFFFSSEWRRVTGWDGCLDGEGGGGGLPDVGPVPLLPGSPMNGPSGSPT